MHRLPPSLFKKLERNTYFSEAVQSLFYHISIFKTSRRANESTQDDCHCTEYDPFVFQKSPFFCAEDKIVSADEVYAIITDLTQRREVASKGFVPRVSLGYLKSKSGDYIPISTVDRIFRQEINDFWNEQLSEKDKRQIINENYSLKSVATNMSTNPEEGDGWPIDPSCWVFGVRDGGDCGCCFNYSGPCWYCSLACYVHDQTCETCMPEIYCLPGCVPGPC